MKYEVLLNLNFYLFKKNFFLNKIIFEKIYVKNINFNIINYYNQIKKFINLYNPFYGVKIDSYFNKIKINLNKNIKLKLENDFLIYKKKIKYKISYKELSYIFNISIEKIRIKYV
ncbi:MAG: hypothetical protein ACSLEI_00730 [Candidatus Carsonella ruddii]